MTHTISLPRLTPQKVSDQVYELLHEKIVSSEFKPGQRLDINAIADQLGISRIPIKEALTRLQVEGLVDVVPRSGTFVANPSPKEIADVFDLRRVLETYAMDLIVQHIGDDDIARLRALVHKLAELAASDQRDELYPQYTAIDQKLHRELVTLSGNLPLQQAYERVNVHAQMARIRYKHAERELDIAQFEHERILDALEARDAATLKNLVDAHLRRAKQSFMADIEKTVAKQHEHHTATDGRTRG